MLRRAPRPRRNERCWCGSGQKYKYCCSETAVKQPEVRASYIDSGESPVRYVICNAAGTGFFSDKENRIIVFSDRAMAFAIATLEDFQNQEPGEINVAGVGETKWAHLQETLPFVEIADIETAVTAVRERIEYLREQMVALASEVAPEEPEQD